MKKLLALVLALVMTLSLATVSSNAAFKDAKDINENYAEAAAVLNGLGVFKGYAEKDDTFSFKPQGDITRAEVAAIVYRIYTQDVKDTYAKNYATYNKFSDMAGAGWAKGYIGYCANAAFIKGYPDGTFKPSGKVTGYEALAMILRAVGYDQKNEFTGAGWQLHVAQIAEQNNILQNVKGVDLNAAATRELVAELLFQAIRVPMVTYTAAFGYQTVSLSSEKNQLLKDNKTLADAFSLDCVTGYVTANDHDSKYKNMQITGDNLAKKEVTIKVADQDIFDAGRYGHVWTVKTTAITDVFYDDALLSTSYTGAAIKDLTTKKTGNTDYVADFAKENKVVYNGNENATPVVYKGTEVAMYSIDGKTISSIIVVNPIVDIMNADYVVKGDEVKIQGVKYDKDEVSGYEDLVKGDVFTYVDMADGVRYYEELAPIDGQKTKYTIPTKDSADPYITFDGKDYEESGLSPDKQDSVSFRDTANLFSKDRTTFDKDATIYLDRGGYVAYTTTAGAVAKYAMVIDSYQVLNDKHNGYDYFVNLLLTDGTETGYVAADADSELWFPTFDNVKDSKDYYIGQPAATGNYLTLGTLVEYTVKDDVYTVNACKANVDDDGDTNEWLDADYDKGAAAMDFYGVGRKAVTEDTVAFYAYGTPNSTNFVSTPSKKVDVHYGVNTGKYDKDTNEAGIPNYGRDTGARYLELSANNKIVDAVVFDWMPQGDFEDYVYLFKCEKESWTSAQGQLYTYYGVTSEGEVKEFESYNQGRVGTVCYYFLRNDKTYDFDIAPYETNLVSVELLGNKNTVEYRYEGGHTKAEIYSNLDKIYDLIDTSDLKDGDKVDAYDWKWQTSKVVEGMIVVDEDGDVECLFVLDDDVTFGKFTVNGVDYWYPVADYNGNAKKMALSDLSYWDYYTAEKVFDFDAGKYYHIDGAAQVKGSDKVVFEAGEKYTVVEHEAIAAADITVNTGNLVGKTLTVPYGTEITADLISVSNGTVAVKDGKLVITVKSADGIETCKEETVITVVVKAPVYTVELKQAYDPLKGLTNLTVELSDDADLDDAKIIIYKDGAVYWNGSFGGGEISTKTPGNYYVVVLNADNEEICRSANLYVPNDGTVL